MSLKSFEGEVVTLDLKDGTLRVETEESLAEAVAGLGPMRVEAQVKEELIYDGLLGAAFLEGLMVTLDLDEIRAWARRR